VERVEKATLRDATCLRRQLLRQSTNEEVEEKKMSERVKMRTQKIKA